MIEVRNLSKTYSFPQPIEVLHKLNFSISKGSWISLVGPSGSGKTTLLSILAGLDVPSQGEVLFENRDIAQLGEDDRAQLRAKKMGFIFQSFRLLPTLSALENVELPLLLLGETHTHERAKTLLERVGLSQRLHHKPSMLSGGEQQRVAVARAFVTRPTLLLADEPTGNLDTKTGEQVLSLLHELQLEAGATLVVVTHDAQVAARGEKTIRLKDGHME